MNCADFFDTLELERDEKFLGRALAPEVKGELAVHERACVPCAELARAYPIADAIAAAIPDEVEPPPHIKARVLMAARAASEHRRSQEVARKRVSRFSLALAASLLCLIGGLHWFGSRDKGSSPYDPMTATSGSGGAQQPSPDTSESLEKRFASPDPHAVLEAHLVLMRAYASRRDAARALAEAGAVLEDGSATDSERSEARDCLETFR
jgi:hypothetical protein